MPVPPQIPSPDSGIGAAKQYLATNRPESQPWLDNGVWGEVLKGWRAQAALTINRMAAEVRASRLPFASGQPLLDLAASEYDTPFNSAPITAKGEAIISQVNGPSPTAGVIKAGTTLTRLATPLSFPPLKGATYRVVRDFPYPKDFAVAGFSTIAVPVEATQAGAFANLPTGAVNPLFVIGDPLPSSHLSLVSIAAAGGSDGISDAAVRQAAKAYVTGRFAPTLAAISAGSFRAMGVAKSVVFDDPTGATTQVLPVDVSWGTSLALQQLVAGILADTVDSPGFNGFGCKTVVGATSGNDPFNLPFLLLTNRFISVALNVTLTSGELLSNTGPIEDNIKKAVLSYFNDRPDWYTFKLSKLRAIVANADRHIKSCTLATVSDITTGSNIAEPSGAVNFPSNQTLTHYYLDGSNLSITYLAPQ